ncbi:MAG: hypothetical protein U0165_08740 [Polyangiaceae bacterium]
MLRSIFASSVAIFALVACASEEGAVPRGSGSSGTSGTGGSSGTSGSAGTSGTAGNSGSSGTSGTAGTSATGGSAGTGGTSGSAGTGGTSGSAGTGGTSGSAGTGGTAGSAGSGGTSGTGGTAGGGGTAGTGGTSGSSGTSGTGGTGGSLGPEDCFNGVDDNGDNLADCADPQCTPATTCVTTALPSGWSGPVSLYDGAPANEPACPSSYPTQAFLGNRNITGAAAQCSTCTCSDPSGGSCVLPTQATVTDAQCGMSATYGGLLDLSSTIGTCAGNNYVGGSVCGPNDNAACSVSLQVPATTVTGASCVPSNENPNIPAVSATLGKACGSPATNTAGCGTNQACVPKPSSPFSSGLCIQHSGDVSCPAGAFVQKKVYYEGIVDTRTCTACSCGDAGGGTCATTYSFYSDLTLGICSTQAVTVQAGTCTNLSNNPNIAGRKLVSVGAPTGGSCPPSGGSPTGSAGPDTSTSTTFCCIP